MKDIKLSIYIVTYNRSNYLKEAISSVLKQTYSDYKLIILDNASNDKTGEVVASFDDKRIKYCRHDHNLGGIGNINYAINDCDTDYFVIFHDDDIMMPNFLEKELDILENHPECAMVSGNAYYIEANNITDKHYFPSSESLNKYQNDDLFSKYLSEWKVLIFPSLMYRSSVVKKGFKLNPKVGPCADVVFYNEILLCGNEAIEIPDVIMYYRKHEGQDSERNLLSMHVQLFTYLNNEDPFPFLMNKFQKYQFAFFGKIIKVVLSMYSKKRIDYSEFNMYSRQFLSLIKHSAFWDAICRMLLTIEKYIRGFVPSLYRIYCLFKQSK